MATKHVKFHYCDGQEVRSKYIDRRQLGESVVVLEKKEIQRKEIKRK